MPGGIGSIFDGSDQVNMSPPTENNRSWLVEHLAHALLRAGHRAAIERMRGGERRGVRHELGVDRRADRFRQRRELLVAAALRHRVAGDDDRALGLRQQIGGGVDRIEIAADARRDAGRLQQIDVAVVLQDVAGQRQEHRPGRRRQRGLRRAMHQRRQVLEALDLRGEFHERLRQRRRGRRTGSAPGSDIRCPAGRPSPGSASPPSARRRACPWRCRGPARRGG